MTTCASGTTTTTITATHRALNAQIKATLRTAECQSLGAREMDGVKCILKSIQKLFVNLGNSFLIVLT